MKAGIMLLLVLVFGLSASAQVDTLKMMQAYAEFMTPGAMHKLMSSSDGTWTGRVKMWMSPSDKAPLDYATTVINKTIYNGLFQESSYRGDFGGMPYEGKGFLGYDNSRKRFVYVWIDNMGSGISIMEGDYDDDTKTLSLQGTASNPTGNEPLMIRQTMQFIDKNSTLLKVWGPDPATGKEYQSVEVILKRNK